MKSGLVSRLTGLFALLAIGPIFCRADSPATAFDSANRLYEQGKFTEAVSAYEQILQSSRASAAVYFNLGNAWFKAGQIGRAIYSYGQARSLAPRDPDVLANLQFARNQVSGPTLGSKAWRRWLGKISLNEWTLAATASIWCWLMLLILPQWQPRLKPTLRGWTLALGVTAALLCTCFGAEYYRLRMSPTAVVVARDAVVHQSPYAESAAPLTLHDGAEVRILDSKDDWLQITTDPLRIGWLRRAELLLTR